MTSQTRQTPALHDLTRHDDPHEAERRTRVALTYAASEKASIAAMLRTDTAADVLAHLTDTGDTIDTDAVRHGLAVSERPDHRVLIPGDPDWPPELTTLGEDAPLALWASGDTALLSAGLSRRVVVTGSRAATAYGMQTAADLSADLTREGRVIVTEAAYGIDTAASQAAVTAGGPSVAVLASGIDRPCLTRNTDLLHRISQNGVVVSATPPGVAPSRTRFGQRSRLLAALCATVVIVEASPRSTALTVAHTALALRRTVTAVPGPVTSVTSAGCRQLIQNGETHLVTTAADVTAPPTPATSSPPSGRNHSLSGHHLSTGWPDGLVCLLSVDGWPRQARRFGARRRRPGTERARPPDPSQADSRPRVHRIREPPSTVPIRTSPHSAADHLSPPAP